MANLTDEQIVAAIKSGGTALEEVMQDIYNDEKFRKDIFAFIRSRNGSTEDAEDVFQDGISSLILAIRRGKYRAESPVRAYLFGVCRNLWFKQFGRYVRGEEYKTSLTVEDRDERDPEVELCTNERAAVLNDLLARLGDKCKQVLELWRLSYSMSEIAVKAGYKSEGVARKKKHQCLKKLTEMVQNNPNLSKILKG